MSDNTENNNGCGYGIWIILGAMVIMAIAMPEAFFKSVLIYFTPIGVLLLLYYAFGGSSKK